MAHPAAFDHYPDPVEGPAAQYDPDAGKNPVLRGLPLMLAGELISRSAYLQRFFWANAGFGAIKDMPELDDVPYTFHPTVTPLGKTGPMLELGPDLVKAKYADSKARYYTVGDYHALYRSGKTTPLHVAEALLAITRPGARYSDAWADGHGKEHLAIAAARASTERYAAGKPLGILDGVPIGVKDDVDVKGYINHVGLKYNSSMPWFQEQEESAWPVRMLQEAGAVVIGKLRMHELGSDTSGLNIAQGTPTNHLNKAYYPGGSSSGPASATCAGLVPLCVATDAGGSVRIPANFNGLYGLKPSHHRTVAMNSTMCVTGPLAANVADLVVAYRVMSQPDPDCATQGRFALSVPPQPSAKRLMGVFRDWWKLADKPVVEACDRALDWFARQRGYHVVDVSIPHLAEAQLAHGCICITEMAESARRRTPDPADWLTLCGPANKILLSVGRQTPAVDYLKLNSLRTLLMRHLAFLFQKHPGLLIMTPTTPLVGWPRVAGDDAYGLSDGNLTFRNMMYIFLANMTGTPSLSAPVAYVDPAQGDGKLPVSLLATAEWGSEEQLLSWAAEAEEYLHTVYPNGRRRPDSWVDVMELSRESKMA
ncbi:amidase [Hirsutella rhossiliensis]|uniref:Amidase domain-containing protein n=1 Tax=Hirsutella rhossiliensis TaxID=111463 RepID=A0A9P8SGS4_9HYPO|nr:amidase domain-containing protein [Hirsutella rhossiliensis]KAH0962373.1 amidase domain-containing protein [Hirsutella rhossiliensis]